MPIETRKKILRSHLKKERQTFFVFGDNVARAGRKGQALEMRGEPNAIGVVTKRYPSMDPDSFFSDEDLLDNMLRITKDLGAVRYFLEQGYTVVFPEDGIGTGLAQMEERCPKTAAFLQSEIEEIFKQYA